MNENLENENVNLNESENLNETESNMLSVQDFSNLRNATTTEKKIFTNITDQKKIFNLETNVDYKLNDCKGQMIRVKEVLIKIIEKPLKNPEINEETGEIIKDKEIKMVTILIDDNNKSYVTGSKMFSMAFINYIEMFGIESIEKGLEIEIVERSIKNSSNKGLGFKLV